jgi:cytidine deaminase
MSCEATALSLPGFDTDLVELLYESARAVLPHAHAPYSRYPVASAVYAEPDHLHVGVNVENASFPHGLCAEQVAVASAVAAGHPKLRAVLVLTAGTTFAAPCGACRQVLHEFGDGSMPVIVARLDGQMTSYKLGDLLPAAFSGADLDR